MKFQAKSTSPLSTRSHCLVVPVYEKGQQPEVTATIDQANNGLITQLIKDKDISGAVGTTLTLRTVQGCSADRIVLLGAGAGKSPLSADDFDKALKKLTSAVKTTASKDVSLCLGSIEVDGKDESWKARQAAKWLSEGLYQFDLFKSEKKDTSKLSKGSYFCSDKSLTRSLNKSLQQGVAIAQGMTVAKDLGNLPGNVCTPSYLTKEARKIARGNPKLSVKALGEKQMDELSMGSFLSVAKGSSEEGQLIIMDYKGGTKTQKPVVLVGKGITFDTGGISLKPGAAMDEMKFDMCGAASVFGVMQTIVNLELPINVVGVVAAAENMPSGHASKPGDIVTSMSGQTIEILNTDAEGRLVLCDTLTYVERFKPKAVIDIATLTGACVVALGKHATGLFSNNDQLAADLLSAGRNAGDKAWHMPLWEEYQQQLDSNFADMANIGGPGAGSVTAACFLSRFTKEYDWAHLDIAGTAWNSGAAKGATGRPVALLVEYLLNQ